MSDEKLLGNDLLEGDLVRLAALTRDDLPQLVQWRDNIEVRRLMEPGPIKPETLAHMTDRYDKLRKEQNSYYFAVRALTDDQLLGWCNVRSIQWQPRWAKIGIMIGDPAQWDRGYGSDATRVLLKFCFMELVLHRVQLKVISYNQRAIRSYQKVGFKEEGTLREVIRRDGQFHDVVQMALLRHEWEAL